MRAIANLSWMLAMTTATALAPDARADDLATYRTTCEAAGIGLWGRSLCAPVVVVDPATSSFRATDPTPGPLPALRANTAFEWNGMPWVMLLEPLPKAGPELTSLLFHESFHVHQRALGLPTVDAVAGHLDAVDARVLLGLEWRALAEALASDGATREEHVRQALGFRRQRLRQAQAADDERALMLNEGLASYTGVALSGDARRLALEALRTAADAPSPARAFAYASGPAWGLLLDELRPGWRRTLDPATDLPDRVPLAPAEVPDPVRYGGAALAERARAQVAALAARVDEAVRRTSGDATLRLPLKAIELDFDPNQVAVAPDGSRLYWRIRLRDAWGEVRMDDVPLRIGPGFDVATLPWPLPAGATLRLAPGWHVDAEAVTVERTPP